MYCCETLNFPLQNLHSKNGQGFKMSYCNGNKVGMFSKGVGSRAWDIIERIQEYSERSLTNSADVLKGFLGIMLAFETGAHRIRHYWGVPVLPPRRKIPHCTTSIHKDYPWTSTMGFL
jgi:hypothetical protein